MSRKLCRKASLDLSVNSIVVMVIAFVVLGLILTFTRGIFSFGQGQLAQITNVVDLAEKPTSENPIVPRSFILSPGDTAGRKVSMGLYNTGQSKITGVSISFDKCIGNTAASNNKPTIKMIPTGDIEPSKSVGITALVVNNAGSGGLASGQYVCSLKTDKNVGTSPLVVQVSVTVE
ncbi:hypothetical protein HY483_02225 [Candidatus Woesearchaeota archaeon]|nr:hypothetical protein [Candidatus Woesearchaeota archaeon]